MLTIHVIRILRLSIMAEEVIFNLSNFFVKTQILNYDLLAVAVATRRIKTGMEVHDSYGAVWYHMDRTERQRFLKVFDCLFLK